MAGPNGETKFKLHPRHNSKVQLLKLRAKVNPRNLFNFLCDNLISCLFTYFLGADQQDEEALIIPTAETVKQNYFLDLALANCIPLGRLLDMLL